ncbi:LOW QUALITY PROTEIN: chitin deacetylase 1-like [Patella vulgata]|uniref:LOW QUALITY PROTEIN: chitin deacetylase 1-like n=1 Tax=Patella vulgata TaxID=6465 RepID=UPI0024A9DA44|nr:LOW QUALITY PROTEIN: chitin deacetylase 1-like [Patella vulgata]
MGIDIPGGYTRIETPQMVVITFDDASNWENWDYYRYLFPLDGSRVNPNGCPIAMTVFVSNNYTELHARGMEIADHSYTHKNYRTNRAPYHVNLHSSWFKQDFNLKAMDKFIQHLLTMDDVYITTVTKTLEWVKHPTPLSQLKDFDPWKCNYKSNQEDDAICWVET